MKTNHTHYIFDELIKTEFDVSFRIMDLLSSFHIQIIAVKQQVPI